MTRDSFQVRPSSLGAAVFVDGRSERSFARHAHDEFGIGLMTDGAQRSGSGRGPVEAVRGNLITVNPGEMHDGAPIGPARSWSMLYLPQNVVGTIVADLEDRRYARRELHAPVVDDPRLARLFAATRRAALHPQGKPAFEERLLVLLGGLLGAGVEPAGEIAGSKAGGRLSQVRERIDDAPAHPHALADLAALVGLSRYQTLRGFVRLTGLTPHAYVMQRRLQMARGLIRHGSTLADAAIEAGFADQSHMHRIFVARHGFTPGAYADAFRTPRAISSKSQATRSR